MRLAGRLHVPPRFSRPSQWLAPKRIDWQGEWSGRCYDELREALEFFEGAADLVLTWEGGDSFTGLRLRAGVVTEHEVVMTLGPEKK